MGVPDGAHTHRSGGSALGGAIVLILAVALLGPAVAAAAVDLLHILVIVAAVIGGLALAGGAAFVAFRVHLRRAEGVTRASFPARQPWRPVEAPRAARRWPAQPPAIEHHHHVHFHGLAAEDVAAIIRRQQED
jgi:hypothetical protein